MFLEPKKITQLVATPKSDTQDAHNKFSLSLYLSLFLCLSVCLSLSHTHTHTYIRAEEASSHTDARRRGGVQQARGHGCQC